MRADLTPLVLGLLLSVWGACVTAQPEDAVEIKLTIDALPADAWTKNRILPTIDDGALIMRDAKPDEPFDDASMWEVKFTQSLPYGRKELHVDVTVGAGHQALWGGGMLLQPLLNGVEAVPVLEESGVSSVDMIVSADDGKSFIPAQSDKIAFQMPQAATEQLTFAFMTAGAVGYDITLSNFRVLVWPEKDNRMRPQRLHVSSLGYQANEPTRVMIAWHNDAETLDTQEIELLLKGPDGTTNVPVTLPTRVVAISGSRVSTVDLGLLTAGDYSLTVPSTSADTSPTTKSFSVSAAGPSFSKLRDDAWGAFYWITSGPLGPYPDAHLQDTAARVFGAPEQAVDVSGGWYDAGDYGKYAVNGAFSVSLMLLTGLIAPEALNHAISPVGNSNADVPDWLRVADAQLDWLLKMQRADGAVYHKATTQRWPSMRASPEDDTQTKWLMPVSTTATADFAGTMALAAKLYRGQADAAYKDRSKDFQIAAEKALDWLDAHPSLIMTATSYDGHQYGGPYDDKDDRDERFFARAAYAALTDDLGDYAGVAARFSDVIDMLKSNGYAISWQSVGMLGAWALQTGEPPEALREDVKDVLGAAAHDWRMEQNRSSWDIAIADEGQLDWGSNSHFTSIGWHWLMWATVSGDATYVESAQRQLHYLFGLNALDQTYVTGEFAGASAAPHFRPWTSGRIDLPAGFIVGGPNSTNLGGDPLSGALAGLAPMLMYVDDDKSYATNEVAINWQAAWAVYASMLAHQVR